MTNVQPTVSDYLEGFGLSKYEITLYLKLLEIGQSTIANLAKTTKIKRTTAHNNVDELIRKGLITQTNLAGRRVVVAEVPEKLRFLLDQRKWELNQLESRLSLVIDRIHESMPLTDISENKPIVRYYEGQKGFTEVCQRSLDYADKEIMFISNLDEWYKVYTEEYDKEHYIPSRLKKNLFLKILTFRSKRTVDMALTDKKLKREFRFLPDEYKINSTIIIYGNEVSIMTSNVPYMAILIDDPDVSLTFKNLFLSLWEAKNASSK